MHGLNDPTYETPIFQEPRGNVTRLPPVLPVSGALDSVLRQRFCCRRFLDRPLSLDTLATIVHWAYGTVGGVELGGEMLERPVPSGGGLYPLELYLICQNIEGLALGVHHYLPHLHALDEVYGDRLPKLLTSELFLGQPYLKEAAGIVVVTATVERSLWKYEDRGYRYILLEAGHVAQNVNLVSTALGLGSLNLGGFFDDDLSGLLRLEPDAEVALYAIAVGYKATEDRALGRSPEEPDARFRRY